MFGLKLPGKAAENKVRKDTTILKNVPLEKLAVMCDRSHVHTVLVGSIKHQGRWVSRSALAGAYPRPLCQHWSRLATAGLEHAFGSGATGAGRYSHL